MADGSAFTGLYDADGTIKGADYTGAWTVEADTTCFDYGEGKNCLGIAMASDVDEWRSSRWHWRCHFGQP